MYLSTVVVGFLILLSDYNQWWKHMSHRAEPADGWLCASGRAEPYSKQGSWKQSFQLLFFQLEALLFRLHPSLDIWKLLYLITLGTCMP